MMRRYRTKNRTSSQDFTDPEHTALENLGKRLESSSGSVVLCLSRLQSFCICCCHCSVCACVCVLVCACVCCVCVCMNSVKIFSDIQRYLISICIQMYSKAMIVLFYILLLLFWIFVFSDVQKHKSWFYAKVLHALLVYCNLMCLLFCLWLYDVA